MSNEKRGRSETSGAQSHDLRSERDQFLQKFTSGSRLSEELARDYQRMEQQLCSLEQENAALRAKVEADDAIRELLRKIETLEHEKAELVSRFHRAEALSSQVTERVREVETEFANLASLFVATNQLHLSLAPHAVVQRIKEVLNQIVGAERYALYLLNPNRNQLVPVASDGVPLAELAPVLPGNGRIGAAVARESAFLDEARSPDQGTPEDPAAVFPLLVESQVVGAIAIFSTLPHKNRFETVDVELLRLLGQHAAGALVCAGLFIGSGGKLPGLEVFLDANV